MKTNSDLYTEDFYTWTQTTAALIRAGKWQELDPESVAEEIDSLGISQQHALQSHLKQLVMHLLKWQYQPSRRLMGHSWQSSIINARDEIALVLERSPGLQPQMPAYLAKRYGAARRLASVETGLPLTTFAATCPWTLTQVLDDDFFPEAD
jgi:Domain of unknown function DUF29